MGLQETTKALADPIRRQILNLLKILTCSLANLTFFVEKMLAEKLQ